MEWGAKFNLVWLWTVLFVLVIFFVAKSRRRAALRRFGDLELVSRLMGSLDGGKRRLKRLLLTLSVLLMVLALAQPHFRQKEITLERKGIDIMIVVDVSQSMLSKDIAPNRLEKTKLELIALVEKLKQNRIGIVAFAGDAFIQCPLTVDQSAVKLFISTLNPNLIPTPGTSIGPAIAAASQAFSDNMKDHKAIVLLTDGEDHESGPLEQARLAKEKGIHIFTIGIGTPDGSTVPTPNAQDGFKKDRYGRVVMSKLDEVLLKDIARTTGGAYYRASRAEIEVDELAGQIMRMTQKGLGKDKLILYEESFQILLLVAFGLLILEMVLSERKGHL